MFDWQGNSADLTLIEEVRKIMKKNLLRFQTIRKKLLNNICNLWYGVHRENKKKKLYAFNDGSCAYSENGSTM